MKFRKSRHGWYDGVPFRVFTFFTAVKITASIVKTAVANGLASESNLTTQ